MEYFAFSGPIPSLQNDANGGGVVSNPQQYVANDWSRLSSKTYGIPPVLGLGQCRRTF